MLRIDNHGWHLHRQMRNPMADVGRFMHKCAEDPVTRVMATTALVLSLCQTAGPAMMSHPPGYLLINAGDAQEDPINAIAKNLIGVNRPEPRPKPEEYERNRRTMKAALIQKQQQASPHKPVLDFFGLPEPDECPFATNFHRARADNHGRGRAGWYADRYDVDYGWFTDTTGHSILQLERPEDLHQFREDVRLQPEKLYDPLGYGASMKPETKRLSLAGSLSLADLDDQVAGGMIRNSLPVLILPHTASKPLITPGHMALDWVGIALAAEAAEAPKTPVEAYRRLDPITLPWFKQRIVRLRERLRYFPADYEFFVMRTVREMLPCCRRLAGILAPSGTPEEEQVNFSFDLFARVVQGLCLGVEALGWRGYGFDNPGGHNNVRRVLRAVRERGSLSKRELHRNQQWLTAESRDAILAVLAAEGLVVLNRKKITATPFADYWQHILHRSAGEMPEPLWKGYRSSRESAA